MNFGEDLSLDMLSGTSNDKGEFKIEDSLAKDLDNPAGGESKIEDKNQPQVVDKIEKPSEEAPKPPESVAGEEGKETPDANPSSPGDGKTSHIYSSIAAHFRDTGVLPSLDKETAVRSAEDLGKAIETEIKNGLEANIKEYREAMEAGAPKDVYREYAQMKQQLDGISPELLSETGREQLRFNIIAQDFLNRGFSNEEAAKYAQRSQDLGEDVVESKAALERLKEHNESSYKSMLEAKQQEELDAVNRIKEFVNNTDEIIKDIKITKTTKDALIKQMTTVAGRDKEGNPVTEYGQAVLADPVRTKAITEYLFMISNGFKDFSKISTLIGSKQAASLDEVLRQSNADFLNTGKAADPEQSFGINDEFRIDV